jgi:hypothetical protein
VNQLQDYLHLFGLLLVPGAALASAAVSAVHAAVSSRTDSVPLRVVVAAAALPLCAAATLALGPLVYGEPPFALVGGFGALLSSAALPFVIVLPWAAVTAYVLKTPRPVWWHAAMLSLFAVLAGAALWIFLGVIAGAETD